jgi:Protein of unknown function (DUF3500)
MSREEVTRVQPDPLRPRPRPATLVAREPCELTPTPKRLLEETLRAVQEPYVGITSGPEPRAGLFPLRATGISTGPIVDAARAFLEALDEQQRATVSFDIDSDAWRSWSNISPFLLRHGLLLETLSEAQRELALGLLQAGLSPAGARTARDVMRLNHTIAEITGRWQEYGEWLYWLSIFGAPSPDGPWGWQLDGHHLNLHCFVLGDQLVLTPMFMGSEPVLAETGQYAGTRVFEAEEARGLALMHSLDAQQRAVARVGMRLPLDAFTTAPHDNYVLPYQGIRWGELSPGQQARLLELIEVYTGRIRSGHAEVRLDEVKQHLAETSFAWIGGWEHDSPFYYRVHSPVLLIEFDHQPGLALDNDEPSRNHVHTLVRTPNGNDYGKDLLRQHYARFHHPRAR